jgi:hypothetical protein
MPLAILAVGYAQALQSELATTWKNASTHWLLLELMPSLSTPHTVTRQAS